MTIKLLYYKIYRELHHKGVSYTLAICWSIPQNPFVYNSYSITYNLCSAMDTSQIYKPPIF